MCGCSPALPLFQRRIVGALLFWRTAAVAPILCRICGRSFHTETQAQCMAKGWWGFFAFYANLVTLVVNMVRASRHQQALTDPEYRDPAVVTAVNRPVHTTPLRKRPVPILASIVALSLWGWLASVPNGNDSSPSHQYAPTQAARDDYQAAVETGFGEMYMSTVPDRASFRQGTQEMGDFACMGALDGETRDEFQAEFRKDGGTAANSASVSNQQLDAASLILWSSAVRFLCPSVGGN